MTIGLVGPLPPPAGGMATQCELLQRLLVADGLQVHLVQTNPPYRPAWIARLHLIRAVFRLLPYLCRLWRMAGAVNVMHVLANSGWAWHLFAAPAVWIARGRGVPVIVNYRGGEADAFLQRAPRWVGATLASAEALIVPSGFLREVFARRGIRAEVIPNVIDLARFSPASGASPTGRAHVIVTRNLEAIYDIGTAIRAFALIALQKAGALLTISGEGPERGRLEALAHELGLGDRVVFAGRLERDAMAALYRSADLVLNPSTVDNMPNSLLEAYASGVPVVSTDVGGIPQIAQHERTALLVASGDARAMAAAALRILGDSHLASALVAQGLDEARRYAWSEVGPRWAALYRALASARTRDLAEQR